MSSLAFHSSSRPSLWIAAAHWWGSKLQQWRYRQAEHALQGMSDAMLHDIGVARSEITEVTRHGRPSRR